MNEVCDEISSSIVSRLGYFTKNEIKLLTHTNRRETA